jgi:hypothetical protein
LLAGCNAKAEEVDDSDGEFGMFAGGLYCGWIAARQAWHEKAMDAAERGDLDSVIELWVAAKEIRRLAERLDRTSDAKLESLSHYVTEPTAERLAKTHPGMAAREELLPESGSRCAVAAADR